MKLQHKESVVGIPKQGIVIAIDGPAGTGKSSAARHLAEVLDFVHVDTGALYRAIAFESLPKKTKLDRAQQDKKAIALSREAHLEFKRMASLNPANRIFINGHDVTNSIRTSEVSMAASRISAIPDVRAALLGLQRRLGCAGDSILEGRDIGTVIFPDADIKFFLTASVEERAKRRLIELEATGADSPSYEDVKAQIAQRDHGDSTRKVAPLKKASDAIEIDTSSMTLDQVVKKMEGIAKKVIAQRVKARKAKAHKADTDKANADKANADKVKADKVKDGRAK